MKKPLIINNTFISKNGFFLCKVVGSVTVPCKIFGFRYCFGKISVSSTSKAAEDSTWFLDRDDVALRNLLTGKVSISRNSISYLRDDIHKASHIRPRLTISWQLHRDLILFVCFRLAIEHKTSLEKTSRNTNIRRCPYSGPSISINLSLYRKRILQRTFWLVHPQQFPRCYSLFQPQYAFSWHILLSYPKEHL